VTKRACSANQQLTADDNRTKIDSRSRKGLRRLEVKLELDPDVDDKRRAHKTQGRRKAALVISGIAVSGIALVMPQESE
jgi:hypothetical protein